MGTFVFDGTGFLLKITIIEYTFLNSPAILSWKNGNFSQNNLEKVEILAQNILKKWKFLKQKPWKSGKIMAKHLGKMEIVNEICIEKWK